MRVDLQREDLIRAQAIVLRGSIGCTPIPIAIICVVVLALVWIRLLKLADPHYPWWLALAGAIALAALVVFGWRKSWSAAYARLREKSAVYRFTPEHLEVTAGPSSAKTSWSHIVRWTEDSHGFYIFPSHDQVYVLPCRCIDDTLELRRRLTAVMPGTTQSRFRRILPVLVLVWISLCLLFILLYNYVAAA